MDLFQLLIVSLLNGITFGIVLFLLASGFSLIFGVMGVLNLTHGTLYMIGAYVGWSIAVKYGLNFWLAVLAGGITAGLVGFLIERGFVRHLYKQLNEQALLTFGFVHILTNLCLLIWGPVTKAPFTPAFLAGSTTIVGISYPTTRLFLILVGLILAVGLWWLQNRTRVGAIIRAGMDDKEMVTGLGVNLGLVFILVFFLGAAMAGSAGVIGAQLLGVNLQFSINILLLALVVVVVGGMGSVEGALLGGMLIGLIDAFGKALFPELAMFTIYMAMIVILILRPTGILGRRT
jgi:branched-chain amino acid transport system permease protein